MSKLGQQTILCLIFTMRTTLMSLCQFKLNLINEHFYVRFCFFPLADFFFRFSFYFCWVFCFILGILDISFLSYTLFCFSFIFLSSYLHRNFFFSSIILSPHSLFFTILVFVLSFFYVRLLFIFFLPSFPPSFFLISFYFIVSFSLSFFFFVLLSFLNSFLVNHFRLVLFPPFCCCVSVCLCVCLCECLCVCFQFIFRSTIFLTIFHLLLMFIDSCFISSFIKHLFILFLQLFYFLLCVPFSSCFF